ncbi:MAG: MFS transporter, partial [Gaiellales bacterium]
MRRPAVVLLYLVILAGETMWTAIVPLVPRFSDRFQLSAFEAGVLLASTSVAVLLVSIPAGIMGDRLGTRRLTLLALGVMVLADLGQGLAGAFWALLGARLLFGVAFGILWTSGIAWLSELAGERRGQALSLTVTTAGIGGVTGPAFAGVLVDRYGLASPFVVAAGVTALLLVALAAEPSGSGRAVVHEQQRGSMLRAATGDRRVMTSLLLMGTAGFCGSVINLLVPLQLDRNGVSTAAIGGAFAASAAVFIACSALVARLGERAARVKVGAVALLVLA